MKKFLNRKVGVIALLMVVAFAPLVLRKGEVVSPGSADETLVVMTPHNETIRREFAEAFNAYWKAKTGKTVYVDWRTPGGTSEIRMVLDSSFKSAEERLGPDAGIGVDVFFGGGDYIFGKMAERGRFVKLKVFEDHKSWFEGEKGIPQTFTGETYFDTENRWVGVCLARFGICYNTDGLKRIGVDPPVTWDDLGDPKYFGHLALADPTKSGSVARAFEMLVQEKIHVELSRLKREPGETEADRRARASRIGWAKGLNLIQRISANARYFTDAATKIPHDVAQGDAVAGMCVDFYGRTYNEKLKQPDGSSRVQWMSPASGSSTSVDPVAVFRGAPNPDLAQAFVEFLLSEQGQVLWNKKPGSKNGPKHQALRRLPVRPDVYTKENLADFTDPEVLPYVNKGEFTYEAELTGPAFTALRMIIRAMCIDVHDELKSSWYTLAENGFPPRATAHFHDVANVSYDRTMAEIRQQVSVGKKIDTTTMATRLAATFRRNYAEAARLARAKQ
ncbi:ABC-type Fe3+ transport system, substrate-binding protein [Rubritalea squalenifaciens DSM 18772]|uniref:ABC-type Fe3+ transport system, substrate-binding protein n=1 Tax=Rubritalea squalenifaciens DSM 18772 TaxID=1123071 RepID=A0A1M6EX10_9BACT|nr:extracellular solute-binding protein [Rubritalea squalenifaciens]SHI89911.1 ABC-type Fe3+ transport system, substrate-binding protein [Rubritalea squalenifaciens DSM 18772]